MGDIHDMKYVGGGDVGPFQPRPSYLLPLRLQGPQPQALQQLHTLVTDAVTPSSSAAWEGHCQLGISSL